METVADHMPKIHRYGTLCKHISSLCVFILHSIYRTDSGFYYDVDDDGDDTFDHCCINHMNQINYPFPTDKILLV